MDDFPEEAAPVMSYFEDNEIVLLMPIPHLPSTSGICICTRERWRTDIEQTTVWTAGTAIFKRLVGQSSPKALKAQRLLRNSKQCTVLRECS
ncbi:hypothetical protein DMENIID0001_023090 [Sergentomyia squamirostris]